MDSPLPPPPPQLEPLASALEANRPPSSPSLSLSPSLFIIAAIIALVVVVSFSIHLLLRFLSCRRHSSSAVAALPLPLVHSQSSSSSSSAAAVVVDSAPSAQENAALIDSLPVFTLASSLASLPKSSPDCAVCLGPFRPHDELRLLPACCHAFHSSCVDPWLQSTPSCPLCRASIALPTPPIQPPPAPSAAPPVAGDLDPSRSGSFRIELGSISRRRTASGEEPGNPPPPPYLRTYSIGSAFEYLVEDEVEAVVSRISRRVENAEKRECSAAAEAAPGAPGEGVAEAAGGGRGGGWLKEYVDRLASSASSSFSSLRFSGRWSHRFDADAAARQSWDLEGSAPREAEESGYYGFYRWLIGA